MYEEPPAGLRAVLDWCARSLRRACIVPAALFVGRHHHHVVTDFNGFFNAMFPPVANDATTSSLLVRR
jgi:hypothetical protein